MRKIIALILALGLVVTLTACSGKAPEVISSDRILVAYFSASGNTQRVAENLADLLGADIYEIVPEEPYIEADLESTSSYSRPAREQNDAASRPAISGAVENMGDYSAVFLGYPIWWGEAPMIMRTFLESYDFSGKIIVPFCTSANSGLGSSAVNLHGAASGSPEWLDGTRFPSGAARQAVVEWLEDLPFSIVEK